MSSDTAIVRPMLERCATDRPIYLFMSVLFLATAIVGFGPRSAAIVAVVRYGDLTQVGFGPFASNILFLQIRFAVLFPTFYVWAILARNTAPQTHKRMMLLATLVLLDAAIARMGWSPGNDTTVS